METMAVTKLINRSRRKSLGELWLLGLPALALLLYAQNALWAVGALMLLMLPVLKQTYDDFESAKRLSESGSLELILGTRLRPAEIVLGFAQASTMRLAPLLGTALVIALIVEPRLPGMLALTAIWISVLFIYSFYAPNLVAAGVLSDGPGLSEAILASILPVIASPFLWPLVGAEAALAITGFSLWCAIPVAVLTALLSLDLR